MTNGTDNDTFKLPAAVKTQLEAMNTQIQQAENSLNSMAKMGMDTKELADKLQWAKSMREMLLKDFT